MAHKHNTRWHLFVAIGSGLTITTALILFALSQHINLFFMPSDILQDTVPVDTEIRLGGMVVPNSVTRGLGLNVKFNVTDYQHQVEIRYDGILPDLFKEQQGVVVQGKLHKDGYFIANTVLAKHDENYMPPEVTAGLEKNNFKKSLL